MSGLPKNLSGTRRSNCLNRQATNGENAVAHNHVFVGKQTGKRMPDRPKGFHRVTHLRARLTRYQAQGEINAPTVPQGNACTGRLPRVPKPGVRERFERRLRGSYNFRRVHQTLRVTPAMQAGISDLVWGDRRSGIIKVDESCMRLSSVISSVPS